jgi:outer membrane receptor protein involved in Fe transport
MNTVSNINAQAFLVHVYDPTPKLGFTTQAGVLALAFNRNSVLTSAFNLNGSQVNLDQAASVKVEHNRQPEIDKGFFVQEEINYDDKLIATVGLRGDKSSNNGDVNKLYFYPKANAAVNIHKFDFWSVSAISQLKLRVAYGQSGKFAPFGSKYTGMSGAIIGGYSGSLVNTSAGNSTVGPERQIETEVGFDMGFMKNRINFDATYYRKNVLDLLLNTLVPSSSGFSSRMLNAAELVNQGVELGVNALVIDKSALKWNTNVNFWLNRSEITRLDVPAFNTGAFGATLGTYRIELGKSATQIVGIDPNDTDGDGISVWGNAEPTFQSSWSNNLTYKNFDFSFLFHWKQGSENVNLTTLLSDLSGTSADYDAKTMDPTGQMNNGDYRVSMLGTSAQPFVEDASYIRLREVGLFYNMKPKAFNGTFKSARVGVSAFNFLNFFKYNSYDPEVSNFGGGGLSTGVEVTPFPSSKRMMFHVSFQL